MPITLPLSTPIKRGTMHTQFTHNTPDTAFSVYSAVTLVQTLLHQALPPCWVEGEVSNLIVARSGHRYFSLKDAQAQLHCVLFHTTQPALGCRIENGMSLKVWGQLTLYPSRGQFQMRVTQAQPAGEGALQKALLALKQQLEKAGLFDPAQKQALPSYIRRVGVITSPTGAALRDILRVLDRRCPDIDVCIYPSLVQGAHASAALIEAVEKANAHAYCDVLILARGGGSLEDLWAFNHPDLAMAVYRSTLPIITGIGHEIDWTLADGVSDRRAATPSAAAEQVSMDMTQRQQQIRTYQHRLLQQIQRRHWENERQLQHLQQRLTVHHPEHALSRMLMTHQRLDTQLKQGFSQYVSTLTQRITLLSHQLQAHDPYAPLSKGYALISHATTPANTRTHWVKSTRNLSVGQCLRVQWRTGHAICQIMTTEDNPPSLPTSGDPDS